MPDFFKHVLNTGILDMIENPDQEDDELGPRFRGANTPLLDGDSFLTDGESHCPRVAILRKRGISSKPSPKNILSWTYGRAWEALMKQMVDKAKIPNLSYLEEEQCAVLIYDDSGERLIYSARPDLLISYNDKKFPVECKSIQSNNGALNIFTHNKPKLGALLQLCMAMQAHDCQTGYTLYGLMHWVNGYDFSTRSGFKCEPDFATQFAEFRDDGFMYSNGRKTCVSYERCLNGIHALDQLDAAGIFLPERPKGVDMFGNAMKYNCCTYCPYNMICSQYGPKDSIQIDEFIEEVKLEVDVYVRA